MNADTIVLVIQAGFAGFLFLQMFWSRQERRDWAKKDSLREAAGREMNERLLSAIDRNTQALRELVAVLRGRPCLADREEAPPPMNLPTIDTDTLTRKA